MINWGNSRDPDWTNKGPRPIMWNDIASVRSASNKAITLDILKTAGMTQIPEFTTDYQTAVNWVNDGKVVMCRTQLNGHSGAGIVVAARPEDVVQNCPLFVLYKKKKREYRVHVAFDQVIDVQEKRKRNDYGGEVDYAVRNHSTGWVYCRGAVDIQNDTLNELAKRSVQHLGLDFGAVDIIYNEHENAYYVLEVNTAPGLEGTTVEKYVTAFTRKIREYG